MNQTNRKRWSKKSLERIYLQQVRKMDETQGIQKAKTITSFGRRNL